MKISMPAISTAIALAVSLLAAVWFGHAADLAMDKSGVGDLEKWQLYSSRADFCYFAFVAFWIVSLVSSFALPQPCRSQLRLICAVAILLLPFGLFSWIFLA